MPTAVVSAVDPAAIVQSFTATATYDGVFTASASATSRLVVGLAAVDGLTGGDLRSSAGRGQSARGGRANSPAGAGGSGDWHASG